MSVRSVVIPFICTSLIIPQKTILSSILLSIYCKLYLKFAQFGLLLTVYKFFIGRHKLSKMWSVVDCVAVAVKMRNFKLDGTKDTNLLRLSYHFLNGILFLLWWSSEVPLQEKKHYVRKCHENCAKHFVSLYDMHKVNNKEGQTIVVNYMK